MFMRSDPNRTNGFLLTALSVLLGLNSSAHTYHLAEQFR
jgi:hypothetical protein